MSAHKYKSTYGGCKLSPSEKQDRYMWRLSQQVSRACDEYQLRKNGYLSNGFRAIINASVLKTQSENK